jgi:hypothetical protein
MQEAGRPIRASKRIRIITEAAQPRRSIRNQIHSQPMATLCLYIHLLFGFCGPDPFAFAVSIFPEPTFAQMEWSPDSFRQVPGADGCPQEDCRADSYTLWSWVYVASPPGWWGQVGLTKEQCEEARDHYHLRGEGLQAEEADPDMEAHSPVCLPDGRGRPRGADGTKHCIGDSELCVGGPDYETMWRMDATWCGPYPVDPTQTVCKEQSHGIYRSQAQCLAAISEKQKEGLTDISCERVP